MATHSPGPWQDAGHAHHTEPTTGIEYRFRVIADARGCSVLWVADDEEDDECGANIRLVRRAPEMLSALHTALHALNSLPRFRIGPQMTSYDLAARIHRLLREINIPSQKKETSDDDSNG